MTAVRTFVLAAALSLGFAGAAFARDAVFSVTLDAPAQESRIIAQNAVWTCADDTCVARPNHSVSVRACRQLARELGGARITAYGSDQQALTADELARCNGEAAATQQASN